MQTILPVRFALADGSQWSSPKLTAAITLQSRKTCRVALHAIYAEWRLQRILPSGILKMNFARITTTLTNGPPRPVPPMLRRPVEGDRKSSAFRGTVSWPLRSSARSSAWALDTLYPRWQSEAQKPERNPNVTSASMRVHRTQN